MYIRWFSDIHITTPLHPLTRYSGRFLVVAEDDTVLLVEEGKVFWRREEGLARVQSTLFLDLPAAAADTEADCKAVRPSLMDRVNAEVLTVKVSSVLKANDESSHR